VLAVGVTLRLGVGESSGAAVLVGMVVRWW
jgi:hypothetical protein